MWVLCKTAALTAFVMLISSNIASAHDQCGRNSDGYEDGRRGHTPLEGEAVWYESIVQSPHNGSGKEYVYCVENGNTNYHLEFQWGDDQDPRRYCFAMVRRSHQGGCLNPNSRPSMFEERSFEYRRINYRDWIAIQPETIFPTSKSEHPSPILGYFAVYAAAKKLAGVKDEQYRNVQHTEFFADPSKAQFLAEDGSIKIEMLTRDTDALSQYVEEVGPLYVDSQIVTAIPRNSEVLTELSKPDREHRDDDLIGIRLFVVSAIDKGDPLQTRTQIFYQVDDSDLKSWESALSNYPRYFQVLQSDTSMDLKERTVRMVAGSDGKSPRILIKEAHGKQFQIVPAHVAITSQSELVTTYMAPAVQAVLPVQIFDPL